MEVLNFCLFGEIKIKYDEHSIYNKLSHKARCILCYLVTEKHVAKNKLTSMFWEESSESASKYNLRYNIWSVNKIYKNISGKDDCLLIWNKNNLIINEKLTVNSDLELFDELCDSNELTIEKLSTVKNLYKGTFLEGLYLKDSFEFNDWLFFQRENYQKKYLHILIRIFDYYNTNNITNKAIEILEEMIRLNPFDEDIYVKLINTFLKIGDRVNALQSYNRCVRVLREELNISPKKSTEELLAKIKNKTENEPKYNNVDENIKFYLLSPYKIESILKNDNLLEGKTLFVNTIPIDNLKYGLLNSLIDLIINSFSNNELLDIKASIWSELYKININTDEYFNEFIFINSPETERCRLYSAMNELLSIVTRNQNMNIIFNNFKYIDNYSFDFIKYTLFKNNLNNSKLIFVATDTDEKIMDLQRFFSYNKI